MMSPKQQLELLKQKVVAMGALAEDSVHRAIEALTNHDNGLALSAKERDKAIDELELEIDELAINLLASGRSAREVRQITVIMKITRELERIGDEATTICRRAFDLNQDPQDDGHKEILDNAKAAIGMLQEAMGAFTDADPVAARRVIPQDKEVDATNKRVQLNLAERIMAKPALTPRCLNWMVVSKNLERIGDHATNIAEDVVLLFEGRDIRHTGKGKVRREEPGP